jgi:Cytochrome C biogenesis protein transmembrane region
MGAGAIPLAFVAGVVSILSPCVLPILPIVLGAAASEHRLGPAALAGGLSISFVVIGLFAATIGYAIGLDLGVFRVVAAVLMIAIGAILLLPRLQAQLAVAGAPVANWGSRHVDAAGQRGLAGQLVVGLLLGAVWSPCVGPTHRGGGATCGASARSAAGCRNDVCFWPRRRAAAAGAGPVVQAVADALARPTVLGRSRRQGGARSGIRCRRRAGLVRARQSYRDGAGQCLAAMADGSHHAVLE